MVEKIKNNFIYHQFLDFMNKAYEQSKIHGPDARKFVAIFDMDGFTLRQYLYKPAIETIIELIQIYTNNFPEILKFCYVINGESIDVCE